MKIFFEISRTYVLLERQRAELERANRLLMRARDLTDGSSRRLERSAGKVFGQAESLKKRSLGYKRYKEIISREVLRAQEAERARIARELHDEFGQAITALRTEIELASVEGLAADPKLNRHIRQIKKRLEQMARDIQRFAYELRPSVLDDFGLVRALVSLGDSFSESSGIRVHLDFSKEIGRMPADLELALYRIAQEGLTNIAKHARATEVRLSLRRFESLVELVIKDNGIGFDPKAGNGRAGKGKNGHGKMGLPGMNERLRVFGGSLLINSSPGQGTELCAQILLLENMSDEAGTFNQGVAR